MRASEQDATGNAGQSVVQSQFEKLGWGVSPNPYHDLGTDLWLMVRDDRRFDMGLMVGAQVKSSTEAGKTTKYFSKPKIDVAGEITGWTFRDTHEHFKYWLDHAVPHIVVLHDLEHGVS